MIRRSGGADGQMNAGRATELGTQEAQFRTHPTKIPSSFEAGIEVLTQFAESRQAKR